MTERYDIHATEAKWQARWGELGLFRAPEPPREGRAAYLLEMFIYPSGDIHLGHFRNYGIGDAVCRWSLMKGRDVLHPFGWDAFGLPAENAAIQKGIHPQDWTKANIAQSRATLQASGLGYDWSREFATCDASYYRFTQWMFLLLHERGLVYRKAAPVNWCEGCNTVLANEQVEQGRCWRCHGEVVKRELEQWYIRITEYAQRLLDGLESLPEWPHSTVTSQRNWIGRSEGAEIDFAVQWPDGRPEGGPLRVFTTRPDTLWGVTFLTVAPESPFGRLAAANGPNAPEVARYAEAAAKKTEIERTAADREKTGVATGFAAVNPATGERVPIFVSDYVLATYGTGSVMGVPAHDERDFRFAKAKGLPIRVVIVAPGGTSDASLLEDAFTEPGTMIASPPFDGRRSDEAIPEIVAWLEQQGHGRPKVTFRLRDWLISRQRYWGCPIPMIHCRVCGIVPVPKQDLPVLLPPDVTNWLPKGRSPLADVPAFVNVKCPKCEGPAQRDADTMDTFIDSSWYHLRYTDPHNAEAPFDPAKAKQWLPIQLYIGGAEHANGHLIYFRFLTKVLKDAGLVEVEEPVVRMFHHGMVQDADGRTMSKSLGNVTSPIDMIREYGVDATRLAMFFFAPSREEIRWSASGAGGARKLVHRIHDLVTACAPAVQGLTDGMTTIGEPSSRVCEVRRAAHEMLKRFDDAFAGDLAFNTGIAAIYELLNVFPTPEEVAAAPSDERAGYAEALSILVRALAPMAPHLAEELHEVLGGTESVFRAEWPKFDAGALRRDEVEIAIQVNGKIKARVNVPAGGSEDLLRNTAMAVPQVVTALAGRPVRRIVVVPDRLVNVIV